MSRLVCRKCRNGYYKWSSPEPENGDWGDRELTCDSCGNKDTLDSMTRDVLSGVSWVQKEGDIALDIEGKGAKDEL